ncbi:MAG TPA: hypothetical protein PKI61_02240 [bacterium]|nr:hypothetical protein [bacterium]HPT29972.1 hypothetical protein [bacterium]
MKNIFRYLQINYHLALLWLLGLVTFWGAAVYLSYQLNSFGVFLALILGLSSTFFIIRYFSRQKQVETKEITRQPNWGLSLVYIILFLTFLGLIISSRTGRSLVSPFEALPSYALLIYFVLTLVVAILAYRQAKYSGWFLGGHIFLSFIVLPLVYSAGYGYDPFLHRAALAVIDKQGAIHPQTLYYSGQYALEIIIHRLSFIDLRWIDNFLVPVLAGVLIPLTFFKVSVNKNKYFVLWLLLLWPFAFLTYTVPQNLAYLFLLLVIILSLKQKQGRPSSETLTAMLILSLAAIFIQPLAGIPALAFTAFLILKKFSRWAGLIFWGQAIFWPLFFYFFLPVKLTGPEIAFNFSWANADSWWSNIIYIWQFLRPWILGAVAIAMMLWTYKKKPEWRSYVLAGASLFLAYIFCLFLPLTNLATTEKYDYAVRLLLAGSLFLLPGLVLIGERIEEKINNEGWLFKAIILLFVSFLITASFYLAYPRNDIHFNSKGYSVSASDIQAVNYIHTQGAGKDYIVLANQQVGAAAISQFGFYKYYGPYFYYSTQSGGELQEYFRSLMAEPKRETVLAALSLAGVDEGYVVVNNYWWDFDRVVKLLKHEANSWEKIDNGEDYVFWFKK